VRKVAGGTVAHCHRAVYKWLLDVTEKVPVTDKAEFPQWTDQPDIRREIMAVFALFFFEGFVI